MTYDEVPLVVDCAGERLVAVAAVPERPAPTGVVVVVGGPQYRVGSHRQFVQLARTLAAAGFATLRFDCRGMGDASGAPQPFDDVDADIAAAIGALQAACPAVREIALWGLCDGASASAIYANRGDPRVRRLVLVNPWVRSEATYANVQIRHYYAGRLMSREWWGKLARGDVAIGTSLRGALATVRRALSRNRESPPARASFQARMAAGVERFDGRVLLLMSGNDLTAREFDAHAGADATWQRVLSRQGVERCDVASADHTFSQADGRNAAEATTVEWLRRA